ncbi:DUF383-domain-containing protein [Neolentinus lepideus HHB14362 ss-1]|uniref:DUF383-domain-containing protein n=1 Tax=Neolentinus lepideus HHB14362 ss-1 TaxID=1314782 RepID=A0A165SGU8_9AGAM|nr:DUF383-domain-containing protein [Neolentinus lepideus HHB14362 ss-1]
MEDQLRELLPFLHDRNPQVREIALGSLIGHTAKESPYRKIFLPNSGLQKTQDNEAIRDLKLLCREPTTVAHDAFRALVNLSDSPLLATSLSDPQFLIFITSYILNPQAVLADLAAMLLSNLSASSGVASKLLDLKISVIANYPMPGAYYATQSRCGSCPAPEPYPTGKNRDVLALPLLLEAFVLSAKLQTEAKTTSGGAKAPEGSQLHFLGSVFANISMSPSGRMFFLTPRPKDAMGTSGDLEYPLAKLLVFTEHPDTIRRGGVASTIKNCAFHAAGHQAMLVPESETASVPPSTVDAPGMDALPYILLPLAGPEEFDLEDQEKLPPSLQLLPPTKKRETDPVLRLTHVETLLLLCTTRWGRDYLRGHGVYEIVRAMHLVETVDKVAEHVERLVLLVKSPEGPETERDGDILELDNEVEESTGNKAREDDEDSRIEEV